MGRDSAASLDQRVRPTAILYDRTNHFAKSAAVPKRFRLTGARLLGTAPGGSPSSHSSIRTATCTSRKWTPDASRNSHRVPEPIPRFSSPSRFIRPGSSIDRKKGWARCHLGQGSSRLSDCFSDSSRVGDWSMMRIMWRFFGRQNCAANLWKTFFKRIAIGRYE